MPKLCTIDGCERKFLARGLCSMHYNAAHRKPNPVAEFQCAECGTTFTKERARANRYKNLYCSLLCRDASRREATRLRHSQVVRYVPPPTWVKILATTSRGATSSGITFTAGFCPVCDKPTVDRYGARACSQACQVEWHRDRAREAKHRRRARYRKAYVAPVYRQKIYRRDNYTCQLCNTPLAMEELAPHPLAPSIDHVLALANGGTHEPSNAQAAHFLCNSLKGDR